MWWFSNWLMARRNASPTSNPMVYVIITALLVWAFLVISWEG
ncbi:hypothetical protein [Mycolicibacterium litorale]|nr:hypothetical protein [Mycolicibacterium litorale]